MLSTYTVAGKIKGVQVNIPFSFLNELCCPVLSVWSFGDFEEGTVDKASFLFHST